MALAKKTGHCCVCSLTAKSKCCWCYKPVCLGCSYVWGFYNRICKNCKRKRGE